MRIKLKSGFVLLIAVLALSAVGVASASAALPEIVNKEGKTPLGKTFTTTSGLSYMESPGGAGTFCESSRGTGEITGSKEAKLTIKFIGCKYESVRCETEGAKYGEINLTMPVRLVYTDKVKKEIALLWTFPSGVVCGKETVDYKLTGSYLTKAQPNRLHEEWGFEATGDKGRQGIVEYENEKGEIATSYLTMKGAGLEPHVSLTFNNTATFAEAVEFKA